MNTLEAVKLGLDGHLSCAAIVRVQSQEQAKNKPKCKKGTTQQ